MKPKKCRRSALLIFAGLALMTLVSLEGITQALYFKNKVNIPFALKSGSKVVKPGEYLLTIKTYKGQPLLTLDAVRGGRRLRTQGEHMDIPEKDRDVKRGRLRIFPEPQPKSPEDRKIIFIWDFRNRLGAYHRLKFKVPRAVGTEK